MIIVRNELACRSGKLRLGHVPFCFSKFMLKVAIDCTLKIYSNGHVSPHEKEMLTLTVDCPGTHPHVGNIKDLFSCRIFLAGLLGPFRAHSPAFLHIHSIKSTPIKLESTCASKFLIMILIILC